MNLTRAEIDAGLTYNGKVYLSALLGQFTYSIATQTSTWPGYALLAPPENLYPTAGNSYQPLNAQQAANVRAAMAAFDELIAPNFTEVADSGTSFGELRFATTNLTGIAAGISLGGAGDTFGQPFADVWLNNAEMGSKSLDPGTVEFRTLLHEIGHSLGLKHTHEAGTQDKPYSVIPPAYDYLSYSVMSYREDPAYLIVTPYSYLDDKGDRRLSATTVYAYASTPMVLDIEAVQSLYKPDLTTRTGNDVYRFVEGARDISSIYDAGGNDTIDISNFTRKSVIDLNPGAYSSLGIWTREEQIAYYNKTVGFIDWAVPLNTTNTPNMYTWENNLGIAFTAVIENAIGGAGNDTLIGNSVDNILDGGAGADIMRGALGNDVYKVDDAGDQVIENDGEGFDEVRTGLSTYALAANVEKLTYTGTGNTVLHGNPGDNVFVGGSGNDFIYLNQGGNDQAAGGAGNDVFLFSAAMTSADKVDGGDGIDQIALQGDYSGGLTFGSDVVSIENLAILPGNDTRFGDSAGNFYDYKLTLLDVNVAAGVQMIIDANRLRLGEDFTFNGSAEIDGSFFIYGGGGTDDLTGGARNDVFLFGAQGQWGSSDVLAGGGGIDQLALRGDYTITFGANQLTSIEQIALVSAFDTRFGNLGDSYDYILTMNDGNVVGIQMTIDAALLRSNEHLTFIGNAESDGSFRVFGGAGDDEIIGGAGADIIKGGGGGDRLFGNGGADTLTGGSGNDIFVYYSANYSSPASSDTITDFHTGDKIDLSGIDANESAPTDQPFHYIPGQSFTGTGLASAGELLIYEDAARPGFWLVAGDTDGNGSADFILNVIVADGHPLNPVTDFML
ncbi:MAG TPA: M10 family metallopeptidase C-terminal domain-containing protein [Allosphingosinicella sp.]